MSSAVVFQIQSILIFSLMFYGITKRKNRKIHIPVMYTVIIWDILLVLQIELTRSAVIKASKAVANPAILNIHVAFAVSSVVLYFVLLFTGRKLVKGNTEYRKRHMLAGWSAFIVRALTLVTSFFAVTPVN